MDANDVLDTATDVAKLVDQIFSIPGLGIALKILDILRNWGFNPNKTPVMLAVPDFDQKLREVQSFTMTFNQPTDEEGQVAEIVRGGKIKMRLKALNNGNTDLINWMTDNSLCHKGVVRFMDTTSGKHMKDLVFIDAYCVEYIEHWEDDIYSPPLAHWEEITISCKKMTLGKVEYEHQWDLVE